MAWRMVGQPMGSPDLVHGHWLLRRRQRPGARRAAADGKCDITIVGCRAGVSRAALYRSCPHLKAEFEQQFARQREAGQALDRREDQGTRLKARSTELTQRIVGQDAELGRPAVIRGACVVPAGVPVEEIARLTGHSSSRTTEVVYPTPPLRELRPVLTTGAEAMDTLFKTPAPK